MSATVFSPALLALLQPQLREAVTRYLREKTPLEAAGELLGQLGAIVPLAQHEEVAELLLEVGIRLRQRAQARASARAIGGAQ